MIDTPPFPHDTQSVLSPKWSEHQQSLGTPMTVAVPVVPAALPQGFSITNITVLRGNWTIQWQGGTPSYQVELNAGAGWQSIGNTDGHSFSFPMVGQSGMIRVNYATHFIVGSGTLNCPINIAVRTNDDLHLLPVSDGSKSELVLWTGTNDMRKIPVPGYPYFRNPRCEVIGDRVIIADTRYTGQPCRLTEFTLANDTLTLVKDMDFGETGSDLSSCAVDGRAYFFSHQGLTNNMVSFTSLMRDAAGLYHTTSTNLQAASQISEATLTTACGYHGMAWLLHAQDGGGCVSLAQFSPSNTLAFSKTCLIQSQDDLGISGEMPIPTSVVDTDNDRILIGYCSSPEDMSCCQSPCSIAGRSSVVTLNFQTDLTIQNNVTVLLTTPWWGWHSDYPLVCMFPGTLFLDTITENVVIPGCDRSAISFQCGTLKDKQFTAGPVMVSGANSDVSSFSIDRWVLVRGSDLKYRIFQAP